MGHLGAQGKAGDQAGDVVQYLLGGSWTKPPSTLGGIPAWESFQVWQRWGMVVSRRKEQGTQTPWMRCAYEFPPYCSALFAEL